MHDRPGSEAAPLARRAESLIDSGYAWARLAAIVALSTLGGVGMWSIIVAHAGDPGGVRRGARRGVAALLLSMLGFMVGGVLMGKLADRFGAIYPVIGGTLMMAAGYVATAYAPNIAVFSIVFAVCVGMLGSAATFSPLLADASLWFETTPRPGHRARRQRQLYRRHGVAADPGAFHRHAWVARDASGHCRRRDRHHAAAGGDAAAGPRRRSGRSRPSLLANGAHRPLGLPPNLLQGLIMFMGVCCCIAMSMPQVHIVAYCVDLGYGPARGAEMLSLMLGFGIVSRLASGWILDRIGGFATLLIGSTLQALVLAFYIPFDGLTSLYLISAMFGLGQGGIVPSYAFIIRELYPAKGIGLRVSLAVSSTILGMAVGGWMSGAIFDATGSYQLALLNGIAWNVLNMAIAGGLLLRQWRRVTYAGAAA